MKIRTGFVSNSSSSSFVVLGYSFNEDLLEEYSDESIDDLHDNFRVLRGSEDDVDDGVIILGFDLFQFDECGCSKKSYSLQEITQKIIELKLKIKDSLDIDEEDLKEPSLFGGTRCC